MHIITNPTSRKGHGERLTKLITGALAEKEIEYTLSHTSLEEDATSLARKAADAGEDLVLCIGGDGTVSGVAGGLVNSNTALGIIPAGTGDDFARYLGIPKNPLDALDIALNGKPLSIDAAMANDRVFINAAGSGFDVEVLHRTLGYKKIFHGLPAYVLGVLSAVFGYPQMDVKIEYNGRVIEQKSLILSVANGQYIGGGMHVAPLADSSDGLFDVLYVDEIARWRIPFLLAGFIGGSHLKWPIVHHFRCEELTVTTSDSSLQLDGEIFSEKTVKYKILPNSIRVMVP